MRLLAFLFALVSDESYLLADSSIRLVVSDMIGIFIQHISYILKWASVWMSKYNLAKCYFSKIESALIFEQVSNEPSVDSHHLEWKGPFNQGRRCLGWCLSGVCLCKHR